MFHNEMIASKPLKLFMLLFTLNVVNIHISILKRLARITISKHKRNVTSFQEFIMNIRFVIYIKMLVKKHQQYIHRYKRFGYNGCIRSNKKYLYHLSQSYYVYTSRFYSSQYLFENITKISINLFIKTHFLVQYNLQYFSTNAFNLVFIKF